MRDVFIEPMTIEDYDAVRQLWETTENIGLTCADSSENIALFLTRNPGLSFTAKTDGRVIGAVLCGHDGRRGFLHHLAVAASHRNRGVGTTLMDRSIDGLRRLGIEKCHIFVYETNDSGQAFWKKRGWEERGKLLMMSKWTSAEGESHARR